MNESFEKSLLILAVLLFGVYYAVSQKEELQFLTPADAIRLAAQVAEDRPTVAKGVYQLRVQATGRDSSNVYLNSEKDYRDQRNISIHLAKKVEKPLQEKYGQPALEFFQGKLIQVDGEPKKIKIWFTYRGKRTGGYYFQTHIVVSDMDQIKVI